MSQNFQEDFRKIPRFLTKMLVKVLKIEVKATRTLLLQPNISLQKLASAFSQRLCSKIFHCL